MTMWERSWRGGFDPRFCRLNHFWLHARRQMVRLGVEQSWHSLPRGFCLIWQGFVVFRLRRFFCDLAAAYYSVVRQYGEATADTDGHLGVEPCAKVGLGCLPANRGLKSAGQSPALQQLVRDMNEDTWFKLDGTDKVTGMFGGCRPGEPIADLVFVFMFGKVLKEVRSVLMETEYGWTVDYDENQFVEARARRHTTQETEEADADDCV